MEWFETTLQACPEFDDGEGDDEEQEERNIDTSRKPAMIFEYFWCSFVFFQFGVPSVT